MNHVVLNGKFSSHLDVICEHQNEKEVKKSDHKTGNHNTQQQQCNIFGFSCINTVKMRGMQIKCADCYERKRGR